MSVRQYPVSLTYEELDTISAALDFYFEVAGAPSTTKALAERFNHLAEVAERSPTYRSI